MKTKWKYPNKFTLRWFYYKLRSRLHKYLRAYLWSVDRSKLKESLMLRKERESPSCLDCGLCCNDCIAYTEGTHECKLWKQDNQEILGCKIFPSTIWDLKLANLVDKCRYYWEDMGY